MRQMTSLEEGLHRMAEWVKKHGASEGKVFENLEITKNLPESWARASEGKLFRAARFGS
jgi:hypothetical protein